MAEEEKKIEGRINLEEWEDLDEFSGKVFPAFEDCVHLEPYNKKERKPGLMFPSGETCDFAAAKAFMDAKQGSPQSRAEIQAVHLNIPIMQAAVKVPALYAERAQEKERRIALQKDNETLKQQCAPLQEKAALWQEINTLRMQKTALEAQKENATRTLKAYEGQRIALISERARLEEEENKKQALPREIERLTQQIAALEKDKARSCDTNRRFLKNIRTLTAGSVKGLETGLREESGAPEEKEVSVTPPPAPAPPLPPAVEQAAPVAEVEAHAAAQAPPEPELPHAVAEKDDLSEEIFLIFLRYHFQSLVEVTCSEPFAHQPYKEAMTLPSGISFSAERMHDKKVQIFSKQNGSKHYKAFTVSTEGAVKNYALNHAIAEARALRVQIGRQANETHCLLQENTALAQSLPALQAASEALLAQPPAEGEVAALQAEIAVQERENTALVSASAHAVQEIAAIEREIAALTPPSTKKSAKTGKEKRRLQKQKEEQKQNLAQLEKKYTALEKEVAQLESLSANLLASQIQALETRLAHLKTAHSAALYILYVLAPLPPQQTLDRCFIEDTALHYFSAEEIEKAYSTLVQQGFIQKKGDLLSLSLAEQVWVRDYLLSSAHKKQIEKLRQYVLHKKDPRLKTTGSQTHDFSLTSDVSEQKDERADTIQAQLQRFDQTHPALIPLLAAFAYLAPETAVPRAWFVGQEGAEILRGHFTAEEVDQAFTALQQEGLLQSDAKGMLRIDSLDQLWVRGALAVTHPYAEYKPIIGEWLCVLSANSKNSESPTLLSEEWHALEKWHETNRLLFPHAIHYVQEHDRRAAEDLLILADVLSLLATTYQFALQQPKEAIAPLRRALAIRQQYQPNSQPTLSSLTLLMNIYTHLVQTGDDPELKHSKLRRDYAIRALEVLESGYGKTDALLARSISSQKRCYAVDALVALAHAHVFLDSHKLALHCLQRALRISEKRAERDAVEIADLFWQIARVYNFLGQGAPSLENARHAYSLFQKLDQNNPEVKKPIAHLIRIFGAQNLSGAHAAPAAPGAAVQKEEKNPAPAEDIAAQEEAKQLCQKGKSYLDQFRIQEAYLLLKAAADKKYPPAYLLLSVLYKKLIGQTHLPNQEEDWDALAGAHFAWFQKEAAKGTAEAQSDLGNCYDQGIGVVADPKKANFWYAVSDAQNRGSSAAAQPVHPVQLVKQAIALEAKKAYFEAIASYQQALRFYLHKEQQGSTQNEQLRNIYCRLRKVQFAAGLQEEAAQSLHAARARDHAIVQAGGESLTSLYPKPKSPSPLPAAQAAKKGAKEGAQDASECKDPTERELSCQVKQREAVMKALISTCSFLAPDAPMPHAWLTIGEEGTSIFPEIIETLLTFFKKNISLFAPAGEDMFCVQPAIIPAIREKMSPAERRAQLEKVGKWLYTLSNKETHSAEDKKRHYALLLPHLQQVLQHADQAGVEPSLLADLLSALGKTYLIHGQHEEAIVPLMRAVQIREQHAGPDHISLLDDLLHLKEAYAHLELLSSKSAYLKRAFAISKKHRGQEHALTIALSLELELLKADLEELGEEYQAAGLTILSVHVQQDALPEDPAQLEEKITTWARLVTVSCMVENMRSAIQYAQFLQQAYRALDPAHPRAAALHASVHLVFEKIALLKRISEKKPVSAASASEASCANNAPSAGECPPLSAELYRFLGGIQAPRRPDGAAAVQSRQNSPPL